tara:strand:- start:684 stop:1070 length:387 start_codon:yes stop_codon:yes gene_type:complete
MSEKFDIEIISPGKTILKSKVSEAIIPSYEGEMGILKDHIPIITFLRPGLIILNDESRSSFYAEEGTVEFANNKLLILTSTAKNIKEIDKDSIVSKINDTEKELTNQKATDKEKYFLSYKIEALKNIS